MTKKRLAHI